MSNHKKKSNEQYKNDCYRTRPDMNEYQIISEYKGSDSKIDVKHIKCGKVFSVHAGRFQRNISSCVHCNAKRQKEIARQTGKSNTYTPEKYKKIFNEQSNGEYELLSEYVNSKTKITIKCLKCQRVYDVLPTTFQHGYRCQDCQSKCRNTRVYLDGFKDRITKRFPDWLSNFDIVKFTGLTEPCLIQHKKCGKIIEISTARRILYTKSITGIKCPDCRENNGAHFIFRKFLINNGFSANNDSGLRGYFRFESKIDSCEHIHPLRFDISLFNPKKELICLVEIDGPQHRNPIYGEEKFQKQLENDEIKNAFCNKENITLLRFDIEHELTKDDFEYISSSLLEFLNSTTIESRNFILNEDSISRVVNQS